MRRAWALIVVAPLLLSGCVAQSGDAIGTPSGTSHSNSATSPGPAVTGSDIPAPSGDAAMPTEPPAPDERIVQGESEFLDAVGTAWHGDVPDAASLVELGQQACEDIRAGQAVTDVSVVKSNDDFRDANNDALRLAALHFLCPDLVTP